jgi:dCTP deaminase
MIEPFDPTQIDCAAYTLRMGREVYITPDYQVSRLSGHTKQTLTERQHFIIPPGQFAFLLTEEKILVPQHVLGFISLRATIKFRGLINVSGFHVDPGFHGHLIYAVYNAGPSYIHIERGESLFLIWFADLDRTDSRYTRDRQDRPPITNISPALIGNVPGEILTLQSLSRKLDDLERTWFRIKTYGGLLVALATALSLFFGALRINWHDLRAIFPWPT